MRKIILVLFLIAAGAGGKLFALDHLKVDDSSDRRFLPYSFDIEYGYNLGVGRKAMISPLEIFRAADSDTGVALVVNVFNPPLNADAPASIIVQEYQHERVVSEDPLYMIATDYFVYHRGQGQTPMVIAGCYRNDSAFVVCNTPGTNEIDFVYLTNGADHTGNGAWEADVVFLACEDYDYDGHDEAFFYVNPGRDLTPRVLYCIEIEPFRIEWSHPMASALGKGQLASCRDSLNPSVLLATYGPQNGVKDRNYNDYYGYLTKLDRNGRIIFSRQILGNYDWTMLWPLDESHSRFCLFHDSPLAMPIERRDAGQTGGWLSIIDRDGRPGHSIGVDGQIRSIWLPSRDPGTSPKFFSLWNDGTIKVFDTSLTLLAESRPTGLLSFVDTLRVRSQEYPALIFTVSGGMEVYSSRFKKLAFLENAPLYRGVIRRTADGTARSLVLSSGTRGMVVGLSRRSTMAILRLFLWEYQHYLFAFTLLLLLALVVVNYLRVRTLGRLHRREQDLSVVFENMEDCFYRADTEGRLIWQSPSTARLLGYDDPEEIIGKLVVEFYRYPEQREELLAELQRAGHVTDYVVELLRKDGSSVFVSTNSRWWRDAKGNILGVEGIFRDFTARREMEQALRESEEKYRAVIEQSGDNIYFFDPKTGRVLEANEALSRTLGYTPEEMTSLTIYDFIAHDRADIQDKIERAMTHDLSFLSERRYTCKDGSQVDVEVGVTRVNYAGVPALCIVSRDITRRKRSEAALRESEERYRMLVESAGEAIFSVDRDMRYIFMNNTAANRMGYKREELIGRRISEVFPPEIGARQEASVSRVFESGKGETRESITHLIGEPRRYRTSMQPIRDETGETAAVLCIARDITEIYETKEQLEGERQFVGSLLETSNSLIVCLDNQARITVFNHELELVTGYTREEVIGKSWPELFLPEEEWHEGLENFGQWVKQHPSDKYEGSLKTRSGKIRIILWSNSVLQHNGSGEFTAIAIGHDITDRKQAESALVESEVRFTQALDKSRDILYRLNLETLTYDYISASVTEITGYTPEEVIAMGSAGMRSLVHPEDDERLGDHREVLVAEDVPVASSTTEYRLRCRDGSYRWLSDSHTVVHTETDRPIYIIGSVRDITEQRVAQEALRESERFNKTVIQHAPLGVSVRNRTGRLLACNEAWKLIWNMPDDRLQEDMSRERSALRFDDRDNYLGEWREKVREVYENGGSVHVKELNVRRAFDFGPHWISQYFYSILDDAGKVDRVVILTEDITERKLAEEALRQSEEQYRSLQDNLPLGIFRSTPEGKIISVNPAILRMYGYDSTEELLEVPAIATYAQPEQREEMLQKLATEGSITDFETEIRRKDGSVMWISTNARAEFDADGKLLHFDGIDTDITARKTAEEALRASEEKYRRLIEMMNDGLGVIDEGDTITFANDRLCEMLGYSHDELLGTIATDLVAESDKETARAEFDKRREGAKGAYELLMIRSDGRPVHTIVSTTPLIKGTGQFAGSVAVFTDITDRKQGEDLMRIQRDLGVALVSSKTLNEALECLLDASFQIPGIELGGVYIVDPDTGDLELEVNRGLPDDFLAAVRHLDKESKNAQLVMRGIPVYGPFPVFPPSEKGAEFARGLKSIAVVPIEHEDTVLGSLHLASRTETVLSENLRSAVETFSTRIGSIIARIRVQEALRESERRFREMADMLPQTVFEIDRNMTVTFANIQGLRSFGYTVEDLEGGLNAIDLFPPEEQARLRGNTLRVFAGENLEGMDYVALRKDGSAFPVTIYASPVMKGREVVGSRGIVVDITERKRAEKALRDSEERATSQFRSIPVPTYTWETSGDDFILTDCNDKAVEITEGKIGDFIGMRFTAMYPDWSEALEEMRTCVREKRTIRREVKYRFVTTGREAVLMISYAYVPPSSVLVHTEDITERVRAEETLKYRVELERLIAKISTRFIDLPTDEVDNGIDYALAAIGGFSNTDRGYILKYSEDGFGIKRTYEWCQLGVDSAFGPEGDSGKGGFPSDSMPFFHEKLRRFESVRVKSPSDLPADAQAERQMMREGSIRSLILVPMVYAGKLIGVLGFDSIRDEKIWSDEDVTLLRIVAEIFVNTLERRKAEMEVRRVNREKISQARQMAGGFAHEIRNALFPARGAVDRMREMFDRSKVDITAMRKYPDLADMSLTRALDITSLILQYTKLDTERMPEPVELSSVVREVVVNNDLRISEEGVDVRYANGPAVTVESNEKQLYMVLENMLINSIDALEETSEPFISIFWTVSGSAVNLTFSDNGSGIPESARSRVFDAFFSTKPDKGTGIGLATAKKIIEMYEGSICVNSEPGQGTSFQIKLKLFSDES